MDAPALLRCCGRCRAFDNDPRRLETAIPGLSSLSSGDASVRGDDGICNRHERMVMRTNTCAAFAAR